MIAQLIRLSIQYRAWVLTGFTVIMLWGVWAIKTTPIDALPDLSDVQVIIRTSYPGQAPQIVENQITYPLTTTMLSVPGVKTVRGYSFFGDSFVYVLFDDSTDLYWARSRVLEYLNQVQSRLPNQAKAVLGPDATGVGWIYEYALVDKSGTLDNSQLRALQDWFLKFELKTVNNVAEVATLGGMVKQYQVVLDPLKLAASGITHSEVLTALASANQESGGSVLELAEAEYMVRSHGLLQSIDDFKQIVLKNNNDGVPITLDDVAHVQIGPEMRRGVAELNGEGEVVGGVVLLRSGKNALSTIEAVKNKLAELKKGLPKGVEIVATYDRSELIYRAIDNLKQKIIEEFIVIALVCLIFLWHVRSALVAIISLPLGVAMAFIAMRYQGVNANIMSLGGIAIAIGAMVDAAVVMIENTHKKIEHWQTDNPSQVMTEATRWQLVTQAAVEVGPALFFSLLIITVSFLPVFSLQAQEGKLFSPLALTKTYAMAASALLAITLIPVLMGYAIRGRLASENKNPLNRVLIKYYKPLLTKALNHPKHVLLIAAFIFVSSVLPMMRMGGEFMPVLDEGDILYMPSAQPGLSVAKASELLQISDRLIKAVPEVAQVFGKAGRAETATDPAPIEMFETTVQFKPKDQWRKGMTAEKIIQELDKIVKIPGLTNVWVPPLKNRIDMLATGIKSPVGIKVSGTDLASIDVVAEQIEALAKKVTGVNSAFAERASSGRYIDIIPRRFDLARYGLSVNEVQSVVSSLIGGENVGEVIEGTARFPINVRYPRDMRDSLEKLKSLPIILSNGQQINLSTVADVNITQGASMIKSENARLATWVYIDVRERDLRSVVDDLKETISTNVKLQSGVSITYSGQFEFLERAMARLTWLIPITISIIGFILYVIFRRWEHVALIMLALPFSVVGGVWFLYVLGYHFSVAVGVGLIALAGVATEFGVVMLMYLQHSLEARIEKENTLTESVIHEAIMEGAVLRVRPKAMTVAVILAGLLPIFVGSGTGSEVMRRIAAPMLGGMITAPLLSLFVIPVLYLLLCRRELNCNEEVK